MKAGELVELTQDLEDLKKGWVGVLEVVDDNEVPYTFTGKTTKRLGVRFDGLVHPAVFRRVVIDGEEKEVMVKNYCKLI